MLWGNLSGSFMKGRRTQDTGMLMGGQRRDRKRGLEDISSAVGGAALRLLIQRRDEGERERTDGQTDKIGRKMKSLIVDFFFFLVQLK